MYVILAYKYSKKEPVYFMFSFLYWGGGFFNAAFKLLDLYVCFINFWAELAKLCNQEDGIENEQINV